MSESNYSERLEQSLRKALSTYPTGVAIITAQTERHGQVGITCNSFVSISLSPPLIAWSIRNASRNMPAFEAAAGFSAHVLSRDQSSLSKLFSSSDNELKFSNVRTTPGISGAPILEGCTAYFDCRKFAEHVIGDHKLFIGEVMDFYQAPADKSLVFFDGAYRTLSSASVGSFSHERVSASEILEVRSDLCAFMVQLACERADEDDFRRIEGAVDAIDRVSLTEARRERILAGLRFFDALAVASHNSAFKPIIDTLADIVRDQVQDVSVAASLPEMQSSRRRILNAIKLRDKQAATSAMEEYMRALSTREKSAANHVADISSALSTFERGTPR